MRPYNVLFLCTGNSARSILAEAYLNTAAKGRFAAYSAGSHPQGKVNPFALELLARHRLDTSGLRSTSWDEFARPGAPAKAEGTDEQKRKALMRAFSEPFTRINLFLSLPLDKLDQLALKKKLADIGRVGTGAKTE